MRKFASTIIRVPVIGYVLRLISNILLLPKRIALQNQKVTDTRKQITSLNDRVTGSNEALLKILEEQKYQTEKFRNFDKQLVDLSHQLSLLVDSKDKKVVYRAGSDKTFAEDHSLDRFYTEFENRFRGKEEEIIERLRTYLPYFRSVDGTILDIGCGRGEFLELMRDNNIAVRGLDLNSTMVKESKKKGFDVIEDDALNYLKKQKPGSISVITGFHIVEHIPFAELMKLFRECYRVIPRRGFVLFETPNPENVSVGAFSFHYDPSHLKPIPPQLLEFCLEFVGFSDIKILPLHPEIETEPKGELTKRISKRLFGPQDYAVIAYKH